MKKQKKKHTNKELAEAHVFPSELSEADKKKAEAEFSDFIKKQKRREVGDYVVIPELPKEQQKPLWKWLVGQTMPIVEEEGENARECCFKWDYDQWYEAWSRGRIAPVYD